MTLKDDLTLACDLAIELHNLKQRLEDVSRLATVGKHFAMASCVENALEGLEEGADHLNRDIAGLRDRLHAGGVR